MSPVKQDLIALLAKHEKARDWELTLLRMAISLFDAVDDPYRERKPAASLSVDEYFALPTGPYEFLDGRLQPKHWDPVEFRKFKRESAE
ncbi:MAG: hypothetical protein IT162_20150 [Bryobacterales bacterium]|nr:hypothetical protein [Bryobacterales bacterium]